MIYVSCIELCQDLDRSSLKLNRKKILVFTRIVYLECQAFKKMFEERGARLNKMR